MNRLLSPCTREPKRRALDAATDLECSEFDGPKVDCWDHVSRISEDLWP